VLSNIDVYFTNPLGFLFHRYPNRNHKKLMLIDDDIAYIGGINFSEHNFEWHDIMLRMSKSPAISRALSQDLDSTIQGINPSRRVKLGNTVEIFSLDGRRSHDLYQDLFDIIRQAQRSIKVISPYITWPFLDVIGEMVNKGVNVQMISPQANNKPHLMYFLQYQQQIYPFELYMYTEKMSHLKAILVDDETLIMGSSNFDFTSYFMQQELILVLRDSTVVSQFQSLVVDDATAHSVLHRNEPITWKHRAANAVIHVAMVFLSVVSRLNYMVL